MKEMKTTASAVLASNIFSFLWLYTYKYLLKGIYMLFNENEFIKSWILHLKKSSRKASSEAMWFSSLNHLNRYNEVLQGAPASPHQQSMVTDIQWEKASERLGIKCGPHSDVWKRCLFMKGTHKCLMENMCLQVHMHRIWDFCSS